MRTATPIDRAELEIAGPPTDADESADDGTDDTDEQPRATDDTPARATPDRPRSE